MDEIIALIFQYGMQPVLVDHSADYEDIRETLGGDEIIEVKIMPDVVALCPATYSEDIIFEWDSIAFVGKATLIVGVGRTGYISLTAGQINRILYNYEGGRNHNG
jgi:hypothetical protein